MPMVGRLDFRCHVAAVLLDFSGNASLPSIRLLPSTSSNHCSGPEGENLNPRIKSTPGVSCAASASAPLGIAGAFGWVCSQ